MIIKLSRGLSCNNSWTHCCNCLLLLGFGVGLLIAGGGPSYGVSSDYCEQEEQAIVKDIFHVITYHIFPTCKVSCTCKLTTIYHSQGLDISRCI